MQNGYLDFLLAVLRFRPVLLPSASKHYSLVLALTITFACLKISIGLVTSCAAAFIQMFPKGFSYNTWAAIFTVFSFGISSFGLSKISEYSLPVLMFLYPLAITLILLALIGKLFDHDKAVYASVTAFTCFAAFFDFVKTLHASIQTGLHLEGMMTFAGKFLPWFDLNLGWVVPALIGFALGMVIRAVRKRG